MPPARSKASTWDPVGEGLALPDPAVPDDLYRQPRGSDGQRHRLFDVVQKGNVKIEINQRYKLQDVLQAHQDLEGRKTTGSTIFTV